MLLKISWRNIWRNKRRSLVVLGSVIVGVSAALLIDSFQTGMIRQMLFNQVNLNASHIQIHKNGFSDNKTIQGYLPDANKIEEIIKEEPNIKAYSKRLITFGLISSADNSAGIYLYGVDPEIESEVSVIKESIIEGHYFSTGEREILIGKRLAEKLKVGIDDRVVAMANTPDGSIASELFRITGIFQTASSKMDKSNIFIRLNKAQEMLEIPDKIHEFAILTNSYELAETTAENIKQKLDDKFEVLPYTEILPTLVMQVDMYKQSAAILNLVIAIALIFGIINSMLMAVYERIQELGVLMSIGMKNSKIFLMIVLEAFVLGVLGTFLGLVVGWILFYLLFSNGIDFSLFAESLSSWGIGAIIYPQLSVHNFVQLLFLIPFISVLGAVYPAYRAIKLQPVTAIRYV